jgi:5-methylcytosine-specific restriction endonuclease McrA
MAGYKRHRYNKTQVCDDCRVVCKENKRKIRAKNPEKTKLQNKDWYVKNREKVLERNREFRKKNPEYVKQYQDAYRESHKEERNEYRLSNLEKFRSYTRKRIALKLKNGHEPYTEDEVLQEHGSNCHICAEPIDLLVSRKVGVGEWKRGFHIDHLVPLSKGGMDSLSNVRPAHAECNLFKNAKIIQKEESNG